MKEFQVSHLCKAHHINPSQKDLEKVVKLIGESGTKLYIIVPLLSPGYTDLCFYLLLQSIRAVRLRGFMLLTGDV